MDWLGKTLFLLTILCVAILGLILTAGGAWLVAIGGSPYYVAAGLLLLVSSFLMARRSDWALWVYAILLLGTLVWAVWEVGFDFWALVPRGDIFVLLGLWFLLPFMVRRLNSGSFSSSTAKTAPLFLALIASFGVLFASLLKDPHEIAGVLPPADPSNPQAADSREMPDADWRSYGRTQFGNRFSPLADITPQNVTNLKVAWTFRTGDIKGPDDPTETTDEVTPIKINDTLFLCSPHQIAFALNAATGALKWKFDPKIVFNRAFQHMTCRGVSYFETPAGGVRPDGSAGSVDCPARIFLPTNDGRLFALDASSGIPCQGFGDNGAINLKEGMSVTTNGFYEATSPPVVTSKAVIVAGAVIDNYSTKEPSGVIRAFDVYTGRLLWAFDPGNPDPNQPASDTHQYVANSPNSWIVSAYDAKLGLIYIPTGVQTPDSWGGNRTPDGERYSSSLLALHADTGKLAWSYQTVHHDLWDMDLPAQPSLIDIKRPGGGVVPAIYAPAKTGDIFVLDRRDGKPIVPAPELAAPQGAAPGDHTSPTQPASELTFRPKAKLTGADMWGISVVDQLACRIIFHRLRYEGPFTPPSLEGSLVFPGSLGIFEWGGIAVDPTRQIAIANPISVAFVSRLIPRSESNPDKPRPGDLPGSEVGIQPQFGVPFALKLGPLLSPLGLPCNQPPWGFVAGIDLQTHKIVWKLRNGTVRDSTRFPLPFKLGVPALGGPIVTGGGVAFMTGTMDAYIRAYDVSTGEKIWEDRLPAGGQSTPMTYKANGKQFVVTAAGGHGSFGTKIGDYVIAYSLP
jgi:quinoprotein glucose dehydrogenase